MGSEMCIRDSLETLQIKHTELEEKIQSALRSPMPDTLEIAHLKKQKLQIKDALENYEKADSAICLTR